LPVKSYAACVGKNIVSEVYYTVIYTTLADTTKVTYQAVGFNVDSVKVDLVLLDTYTAKAPYCSSTKLDNEGFLY
jgi:hypothetical protein